MTREEAIADFRNKIKRIKEIMDNGDYGCVDQENWERWSKKLEWHEGVLDALRSPWVKTSDRLPTEADADPCLDVFAWHIDDGAVRTEYSQVQDYPDLYTYWMPVPPLPEVEG